MRVPARVQPSQSLCDFAPFEVGLEINKTVDHDRDPVTLSSSSSDTQRMLVSYPPNLESAAAPATAFATSSWPRSGCEMVSRPTALVRDRKSVV